ncbi:AIR synthase-related protein [Butyrivibrio proteoclasticus]|uniref:AIR synthase-related protein n=1 Tax=Butyrivibrio proteoclasticus TaxID=43305 RepID=UPI00047C4623|nr:AIR synthase-related protein [Butyrivibrio proteoclasticus]
MRIGKITENALKRSVLKPLHTEFKHDTSAAVGTDCAFSVDKKTFSTICPVTVDISDPGFYGVVKAANALVAQNIPCDHVEVSILLPVDSEESVLKKIVADAIEGCKAVGTLYAGGHTEVTSAVNRPLVTVTAVGSAEEDDALFDKKAAPDQDLVVTKWVGLEATAMIAKEKYDELATRYPSTFIHDAMDFKNILNVRKDIEAAMESGITAAHDISNGGIFAALWEFASKAGVGLDVDLRRIPIRQETVEICDHFGLNPYQILSGGALLLSTDNGERLVGDLQEKGIPAAIIGRTIKGNDRMIHNLEEERYLDLPQSDEALKILS